MSKGKLKLHQGQIDCVKRFIQSFQFHGGNLALTDYLEFDRLDESLLKDEILQENFDKYQLGLFIQNLAWKLLSSEDKSEQEKLFASDEWLTTCLKNVINTIESFPLEYTGAISLPAFTTEFPLDLEITPQISIYTAKKSSSEDNLVSALMKTRGFTYWQTSLLSETTYINIKAKGYCDGNVNSTASNEFLSTLKQLLALALISDLIAADKFKLSFETNQKLMSADRAITPHWIMKTIKQAAADAKHIEVPPDLAAFINTICLNSKDLVVLATDPKAKTLLGSVYEKEPENSKEINEALKEKFKKITSFFNLVKSFDKDRICSALEWFLEAKITSNQSVSLIYFCIGLEAILGDDSKNKELQLKEKLADRVAYMIGNTNQQRAKVRDDFRAIYSARSDLVHAKEPKISKEKIDLLGKSEVMLSFLISREISGLLKSIK